MKQAINFSPVFVPASKTLDFSALSNFDLKKLYAVINITQNQIIYAVGQVTYGYSAFASNILTLVFDTTTHNAADNLMVIYDNDSAVQKSQDDNLAALITEVKAMNEMMQVMLFSFMNNQPQMDVLKRLQVAVTSLPTLGAVTTVGTVSAMTALNNFSGGNAAQIPYQLGAGSLHLYDKIVTA